MSGFKSKVDLFQSISALHGFTVSPSSSPESSLERRFNNVTTEAPSAEEQKAQEVKVQRSEAPTSQ